jgi:hypothetical protein
MIDIFGPHGPGVTRRRDVHGGKEPLVKRNQVIRGIAAVALAVGGGAAIGSPAQAALPTCTTRAELSGDYGNSKIWVPAVPVNYTYSVDCLLKRGARNDAVKVLQASMANILDRNLSADGDFGPATQQAVRDVQRVYGIRIDGEYGPQTRGAMCWLTVSGNACDWL